MFRLPDFLTGGNITFNRLEIIRSMTTAMLFFLLKKKSRLFRNDVPCPYQWHGPLLIAQRENATIEELKQVSRLGTNETATRCSVIQMLLAGADRQPVCKALLVTNRALRKWFNNHLCKNEEKLLERLDQAILDVIDNPEKNQQTTAIGTLF